jgi:hypothetical protein
VGKGVVDTFFFRAFGSLFTFCQRHDFFNLTISLIAPFLLTTLVIPFYPFSFAV